MDKRESAMKNSRRAGDGRTRTNFRAPYEPEVAFYATIKSGDVKKTRTLCKERLSEKRGLGRLSKNPLQSLRYHLAITLAMMARGCIDGGMELGVSYGLSDFYIQQLDVCESAEEIDALHDAAALDYASRMRTLRAKKIGSAPVSKCVDFIHENVHSRITMESLAERAGLAGAYLSRLFKKETGMTISAYIRARKVDAAKNLLARPEFSLADVAYILAFASQSHFTDVFRKATGLTPKKFRERLRGLH